MKNCTTCRFNNGQHGDRDGFTSICEQGHSRNIIINTFLGSIEIGKNIYRVPQPILDCHAWQAKEDCPCGEWSWKNRMPDIFDITCKKCGRKVE